MNRGLAGIFVFKMRDCLFVSNGRMQLYGVLLPFQISAGGNREQDGSAYTQGYGARRSDESQDTGFHFFEE